MVGGYGILGVQNLVYGIFSSLNIYGTVFQVAVADLVILALSNSNPQVLPHSRVRLGPLFRHL